VIGSDNCEAILAVRTYYQIEKNWPTAESLNEYMDRQAMQTHDPERFFEEEKFAVRTPGLERLETVPTEEVFQCPICGEHVQCGIGSVRLPCGHAFHGIAAECLNGANILTWLHENKRCPVCRTEVLIQ
jgi:rubrerythrin